MSRGRANGRHTGELTEDQAEARRSAIAKLAAADYRRRYSYEHHPQCCQRPVHLPGHALQAAAAENA